MGYYIDVNGNYYEGDKASTNDIKVSKRPSLYHKYDVAFKKWIIDEEKVMKLKEQVLEQLDKELRKKTLLLNLSEEEKEKVNNEYNEKIKELSSTNDPLIIQKIKL